MKKVLVAILIAVFLGTAIAVVGLETGLVTKNEQTDLPVIERPTTLYYVEPEDGSTPYFEKRYSDDGSIADVDFNVISFTDTHIESDNRIENTITLTVIDRVIKAKQPDLVVITGDVCLGDNPLPFVDQLAKVFEDNKTYWAVVLGNHDAESTAGPTREELIRYYEAKPYSITKEGPEVGGEGNYMVNVKNSKGIAQTLVFMDSGAYITEEIIEKYNLPSSIDTDGYGFITPEAQEWYKEELYSIKEENGGIMPNSMMFMHIPFREYNNIAKDDFIYGIKFEFCCPSDYNSGMFNTIKEVGSTKIVVCGHDHVNSFSAMYEGVKLMYSLSSSYGSYHSRDNAGIILLKAMNEGIYFTDGHTTYTVSPSGNVVDTPCYNDLNLKVFEGLEEEFKEAGIPFPEIEE